MWNLEDSYGRRFSYLRLSVTDACNFRCTYCLPNGYHKPEGLKKYLNLSEIENLLAAFIELGIIKVRLTGGEPTLRRDLLEIIETLHGKLRIPKIALSTNGYRLKSQARALRQAGVQSLNVSVDSLDPARFREITGFDLLSDVLEGIETSLQEGFPSVKINAVLFKGHDEFDSFSNWIRSRPVTVRFIELMPTGRNKETFGRFHESGDSLKERLSQNGWRPLPRPQEGGPAQEYSHPEFAGRFGIIAPYSKDFCTSCNRLRITSQGDLRLCLFGEGGYSLRPLLQSTSQKDELVAKILDLLKLKESSHYLNEGKYGNNQTFSAMGG